MQPRAYRGNGKQLRPRPYGRRNGSLRQQERVLPPIGTRAMCNPTPQTVRKPWSTYPTVILNGVKHLTTSTLCEQISHFARNDREKGRQRTILGQAAPNKLIYTAGRCREFSSGRADGLSTPARSSCGCILPRRSGWRQCTSWSAGGRYGESPPSACCCGKASR